MRVLIAPDKFAGTLTAVEAAQAMAAGWSQRSAGDDVVVAPMADGGPGFVDVLHEALGGELSVVTVDGPLGTPTPATLLRHDDTVYLESAQACGLHLVDPADRDPERSSTRGVGQALLAALATHPRRVVVGLGGSATNDAGAGLLAALGCTGDADLGSGPQGFADVTEVDLDPARARLLGVELVVASDVQTVLLGMFGATKTYGPQKGLDDAAIVRTDARLDRLVVACCGRAPAERRVADAPGAGAAGGLGFALLLLGATVTSGIDLVADAVGLPERARACDVVLTGEGAYDFSSREGKVVYGVARVAAAALRPCVVLAGSVLVGSREMRAMGVEAAYSVVDLVGEDAAFADPTGSLTVLAERVARTWSRQA